MGLIDKEISIKLFPFIIMAVAVVCAGEAISASSFSGSIPTPLGKRIRCIGREREALITIKQSLIEGDYGDLSSWGSEDSKKECCFWDGVECSNTTGHVTGLSFDYLRGEISSALLELHHLKEISFYNFGGNRIPEFIYSIKSLQHLELRFSNFSGIIPPQLGNLTNLRTLTLLGNHLWSDSLDWLPRLSFLTQLDLTLSKISDVKWLQHVLQLPSMQELSLDGCSLTDVTPSTNLFVNSSSTSLSSLRLSENKFTSSIFDWLFNISMNLVLINLSGNELDDKIPDDFGKLIHLKDLYLSDNMFEGEIPKSFGNLIHLEILFLNGNRLGGSLQESLGNLSCKVKVGIDLSNNQLTGSLPDLSKCAQLTYLDLSSNELTGSVPANIGQLSNLEYLGLSRNSFHGTISDAHFAQLQNLHVLDLSFNSLSLDFSPNWTFPSQLDTIRLASCKIGPSFPTWLQSQRSWDWLDLSSNGISDKVPEWFWNLSQSTSYMNISHNQMSGTIPDLSSHIINAIDISSNKFSGPLPLLHPNTTVVQFSQNRFSESNISSSICTFPFSSLLLFDLSNNQLSGAIPNCWENMTSLQVLNMNNNSLSSEIPHSLGYLQNLRSLHLGRNNLFGEMPSTLKNCQLLQLIDVGGNKLSGNITTWIGEEYANLAYLNLRGNQFYGGIPQEICMLTRIQMLDLSRNNLSGKIPPCFNKFTSLVDKNSTIAATIRIDIGFNDYIDYALVQWKGVEQEYKNILGLLKLIDLSCNKLVGSIPKAFSNLRGLISLNLSRNSLAGNMDPNIGEMEMLECLDLSRNQLSGRIPISLVQLTFLAVLDLGSNNLSGKIPLSTQLQSFDESAFGGNSNLCGKPLPKLCPEDLRPSISGAGDNNEEESDGFFNFSSMQELCLSIVFGFIVGFWGAVGSLIVKKPWRSAFFKLFDDGRDWLYVTTTIFVNKFRRH